MLLANSREPAVARRLCLDAAEVFRRSGLRRKAALCDLLLARCTLFEGDPEAAGRHCDAADERLRDLDAPLLNYQAQLERGRILETQGDDAGSRRCYTAAAADLEMLRGSLQGEDLKIAFSSTKLEVYERLAALALKDGLRGRPAEEAFGFMERAKSRSLAEALLGRSAPLSRQALATGPSAVELRRRREELNWFYHRIRSEEIREHGPDPARLESLWASARNCENELLDLVRVRGGRFVEHQPGLDSAFVGVSEIRTALEPGSVLVQYFQIGDRIVAGVLTPTALEIVPLAKVSTVRKRLRMMQLQISTALVRPRSSHRPPLASGAAMIPHLQALYHDLIAPFESHLEGGHLILAPHGCLHYVPLHALHDGTGHLIDRYTVSYVPSASVYSLCRRLPAASGTRSLVVGVNDEKAPWIVDEVREVASAVPNALVLTGSEARLSALERWGADSRLIHIASHGSFRSDNPLFSAIRLADSYLSVYDLYNTRLPADLLTLSGCATGLNVIAGGDELLGLVRGLLCAGARSLLLTLWDIDDRGTAEFMRHFYTRLRGGEGKAQALKHAMWEMRERYPHPAYWAPFVLVGNIP
jgi:CHAT domain-containing protein